jgi:hypothetical protein
MLCPQGVKGPWKAGIVLDWHTLASQVIGENEFGHPIFDTQRVIYSDTALTKPKNTSALKSVVDPDVRRQTTREFLQIKSIQELEPLLGTCPPDVVQYLKKKINLQERVRTATQSSLGI